MITTGRTGAMTTIALFLFGMAPLFNSVSGATCTSNTCVASMFTLATCSATTHLCSCEAGHVPVRTGCGKKYSKPKVILPDGYSFEVLEGKNAELKCSTDAPFVDWYYDNGTFVTTGTTYTLASSSAANVGKIK
ncbi:uncharacterized protein LOC106053154 [Biomphalaria glabrata]|uniref:Uncharacterized protein LOC106053154 n=1 Tax=Biomphalaria glabrata TaxID=6526 RepID=A0A9W3BID1_BIOGL|nr:uncharacterized protein LOC106053154 [Biomphalaria glabrata]